MKLQSAKRPVFLSQCKFMMTRSQIVLKFSFTVRKKMLQNVMFVSRSPLGKLCDQGNTVSHCSEVHTFWCILSRAYIMSSERAFCILSFFVTLPHKLRYKFSAKKYEVEEK